MAGIDLQKLKAELEAQLESLVEREQHVEEELARPIDPNWEEGAIETEGDEVLIKLEDSMLEEISLIKLALHRIETGKYGKCVSCGQDISASRLKALSEATSCIGCA